MKNLRKINDFLPETNDREEEQWNSQRVGTRTVAMYANQLGNLALYLSKTEAELRGCFVQGFKHDHPMLWRRLKSGFQEASFEKLVSEAKLWQELNLWTQRRSTANNLVATIASRSPRWLTHARIRALVDEQDPAGSLVASDSDNETVFGLIQV